jgi:transcription elongation factor Elf1
MDQSSLVAKYEASGCSRCPKCGSEDLEGGRPQVDSSSAWQTVTCNGCGFEIVDVYNFSHAELVN